MARGFRNRFRNRAGHGRDEAVAPAAVGGDGDSSGSADVGTAYSSAITSADGKAGATAAAVQASDVGGSLSAGGAPDDPAGAGAAGRDGSPDGAQDGPGRSDDSSGAGGSERADHGMVDDAEGEWLAYDLHEWALESRLMLSQLLVADDLVHSWQGTTLLAHHSTEEQVDALIEEVKVAENLELDRGEPQIGFEMDGWSGEMQAQLAERLGAQSIPHEFDSDGDLACHEADEARVEAIIDELLARAADEDLQELEGLEANDLLSALFDATDRLRRDVRDSAGVLGALQHGRRLAAVATPFGFSAANWAQLRERAGELADLLESDESSEAEIGDLAAGLRDALLRII